MNYYARISSVLALTLTFFTGCMATQSVYPDLSDAEIQQERKIQQEIAAKKKLEKQDRKEYRRLEMKQRLVKVGQRIRTGGMELCKAIKDKDISSCIYKFELTKEGQPINAYADGKKIYVTPSMMRFANTDADLAVVLGHEYAHNVMEHITSKKSNIALGSLLGKAVDLLASSQGIGTGGAFSNIGTNIGAFYYSQSFEKEADYVGLYVTALSGYAIEPAPHFWRRMSLKDTSAIVEESSTHPTTPERFVMLKKVIIEINKKRKLKLPLLPELKKKTE
jgi:predicted Zn-dependent protease